MFGCFNKLLNIDATKHDHHKEDVGDEILERTLGGKGLALLHLLLEKNPPGVDPMSPENLLVFATGPAAGTQIWGSCRYGVFTKSPQTGYLSESYSGGFCLRQCPPF